MITTLALDLVRPLSLAGLRQDIRAQQKIVVVAGLMLIAVVLFVMKVIQWKDPGGSD